MNKIYQKAYFLIILCNSFIFSSPDVSIMMLNTENVKNYVMPLTTMLGSSINSGYFRKAATHKLMGIDLTIDLAYANIPTSGKLYDFIIPEDSFEYTFLLKYPKVYLNYSNAVLLEFIPDTETENIFYEEELLLNIPLNKLLMSESVTSISGDMFNDTILFNFDLVNQDNILYERIVDDIWSQVENVPGIGETYYVYEESGNPNDLSDDRLVSTIPPAFQNSEDFRSNFADQVQLDTLIKSTLENLGINIIAPGGFDYLLKESPFNSGIKLPIMQASIGLPYYTELTIRALPKMQISTIGDMQFGGIGGKVNISHQLSRLLDLVPKYRKELDIMSYTNIFSPNIKPRDVDKAVADFRKMYGQDIDEIKYLDSLNTLFRKGDNSLISDIQNSVQTTLEKIKNMPKAHKDKNANQLPLDVTIGYYLSYYNLNLGTPEITSLNKMFSIQFGKTFNTSFASWLGGVGIYGGIGFETSNIDLIYTYTNTLNQSKDVMASFDGKNKFRSLIGTRVRILFIDAYIDYNIGATNTINTGVGFTFR